MTTRPDHHPGAVLSALGRPDRLKVFAAVVLRGPVPTSEVAAAAGESEKVTARALRSLAAAGVVTDDAGAWEAIPEVLAAAARAAAGSRPKAQPEGSGATAEQAAVLRAFVVDGRLERLPAQRSKRLVVLDFLAQCFEPGVRYREAEVNGILGAMHPDHATLRRELVDEGFLERADRSYWRAGGTFEVS